MADPSPPTHQAPTISPLEQEVLDEYTLLLSNLNKVRSSSLPHSASLLLITPYPPLIPLAHANPQQLSNILSSLADRPTAEILDGLRMLERKTSLVCTLLKASVYSIVLQQQIYGGEEGEGEG
ncbi:hypothetical protein MMC28_005409 [Mycoblastus sanguinarius]|nr:hypothetical protein [Mycoblastus sanguinarius]